MAKSALIALLCIGLLAACEAPARRGIAPAITVPESYMVRFERVDVGAAGISAGRVYDARILQREVRTNESIAVFYEVDGIEKRADVYVAEIAYKGDLCWIRSTINMKPADQIIVHGCIIQMN